LHLQHINPSTSPNELNTTLTPHSMIHGDACFAYFNKIWGIPAFVHYARYSRMGLSLSADRARPVRGVSQPPNGNLSGRNMTTI